MTTPDHIKSILDKASQDKWIKAIILRIDSPGGEVTATDLIYYDIRQFKEQKGIPVYVSLTGVACSGTYYIACAADKIYSYSL